MTQRVFRLSRNQKFPRAKKSLGQNFLVDPHTIDRIVDACQLSNNETILEIGPGTGALTRRIVPLVKHLLAVEKDVVLVGVLEKEFKQKSVEIICGDFLQLELSRFLNEQQPITIVGNLPYYISTPIITKVIEQREYFKEFYCTVQKEFAQRLSAVPNTKDYGALSCFVQYYADVHHLFNIKNTCFKPKPKVDSTFLKLTLRHKPEFPSKDESFLFKVIRQGFNQRRKTLLNALSPLISKNRLGGILETLQLSVNARAEQLSLKQFVLLSQRIQELESDIS